VMGAGISLELQIGLRLRRLNAARHGFGYGRRAPISRLRPSNPFVLEEEAMNEITLSPQPSDSRVRRAAKRSGLVAKKSRRQRSSANFGGFMLIDPRRNWVVAGSRFELTAKEVIDYCSGLD